MKYGLRILPSVTKEARRIHVYREMNQGMGAGGRFMEALGRFYDDILANPYGHTVRKAPFRHAMLHWLKYRVVYKVEGPVVSVVQVRHTSRKPSKRYGP